MKSWAAAAVAFAGMTIVAHPAGADPVADFYKGKTVSVVVGFAAGGGADLWGRFFAKHIGNFIPGKPNVIVQNLTGASGFAAVNSVYNVGPHDGTRILMPTVSAPTAKALGYPNVRWDTLKFQWLGNLVKDAPACVASGRSGIKSITEAKTRQIIFGSDGASNSTSGHPRTLAALLGYKIKIIVGYSGTSRVRLAMDKGEVDAVCSFWASSALGPQRADMDSGKLVPIVQMGEAKYPIFGNAPTAYSLARNQEDLQVMHFVFGPSEISRPAGVSPKVPHDRVEALRKAFWDAANSDEMKADAKKLHLVIGPVGWKETTEAFRKLLDVPPSVVERARTILGLHEKKT
jgi:tripartite-type tricarboxylate transporter receptor subunit TctC